VFLFIIVEYIKIVNFIINPYQLECVVMYMEKVNIKKINELFNGDSRKRLIIKTCAYIQQYYSNRPVMVVVDGDTIYTGRLSTLKKSSMNYSHQLQQN